MIETFGRKLMSGDVLELPNLKDYYPLNTNITRALPKYYVIQDAAYAAEGFSQTWLPHTWRVKATPMVNAQEYKQIIDQPFMPDNIWDPGNFYPQNEVVKDGDRYYEATQNVPPGVGIDDPTYWALIENPTTLGDADSMHTWIKENYLLYSSWIIQAGNMEAPIPTDMPEREPEGNLGTRERDYAPIKEGGYVIFASFTDPDCKDYLGYMAIQLNKCVASWLGSDAVTGVQTYYRVRTTVSESMITTTTQMFSDAQCTHPATPTVNMTNNMACNAWGSHDKVFSKFSFAKAVPEVGAGAMFAGYGDAGCSTGIQEALYVDVADGTKCSGGIKGICDGTTKATLVHYIDVDYECNNHAVAEGYPMTVSSSCAWDNSYGLSAYGKAICGTPSEGYMAVAGVAPQLGGAYVIPDLEVWKPEEAANGEPMESPAPEVKEEIIVAPVAPEDEEQLASQKETSTDAAQGGPMAQKNGPPPGSVKTA